MHKSVTQAYRYRPTSVFDPAYMGEGAASPHKLHAKPHHEHRLHHRQARQRA